MESNVYYLELIQKFWSFNQKARLNTTAVAMYLYLLKLANDNGGYEFSITDSTVADALSLTRKTVKPTKEKLRALGLLQFENKRGHPCSYRLLLDYAIPVSESVIIENTTSNSKPIEAMVDHNVIRLSDNDIGDIAAQNIEEPLVYFSSASYPSWEEFLQYARTLEAYNAILDSEIRNKYCSWVENDWKNAAGRPITNWRSSLKSTLPFMKTQVANTTPLSMESISKIKRPKTS